MIGGGSIGKRHAAVLRDMGHDVCVVSGFAAGADYAGLMDVPLKNFSYFVIASETSKHLEQLKYLSDNIDSGKILCEKPLFDVYSEPDIKEEPVFVGYVMRFHPVVKKLKDLLKNIKVHTARAYCGSYLPEWRTAPYENCYSSWASRGGGVLTDLSHELDYVYMLLGRLDIAGSFAGHVSNLTGDSFDTADIIGVSGSRARVCISLDYLNHGHERYFTAIGDDVTVKADFVNGVIHLFRPGGKIEEIKCAMEDRNSIIAAMHQDILTEGGLACGYGEALDTMRVIKTIQEQNR